MISRIPAEYWGIDTKDEHDVSLTQRIMWTLNAKRFF